MTRRAFTLLEVMVAVAILGLSLTVILSAQAGLYAASSRGYYEGMAIGMVRCKMGELEEEFLRVGYQELDVSERGECCGEQTFPGMECEWKVERVELPEPASFEESNPAGTGADLDLGTNLTSGTSTSSQSSTGPLGALFAAGANDGQAIKEGGLGALTSMLGESASSGVAGLAPMVMGIVYPSLKPMLEASIRKVTVTVRWKQGLQDRDLEVVQYVTNPMRGGLSSTVDTGAMDAIFGEGTSPVPVAPGGGTTSPRRPITPRSPMPGPQ